MRAAERSIIFVRRLSGRARPGIGSPLTIYGQVTKGGHPKTRARCSPKPAKRTTLTIEWLS